MKLMNIAILILLAVPAIAFADEGSYKALQNNIGYTFEGVNAVGQPCAAAVDDGGIVLNFKGTNLTYPLSMPWNEMRKGWLSSTIVYREKDSLVCRILTPNHCESSLEGKIEIQTNSEGFISTIKYVGSNKQAINYCKF